MFGESRPCVGSRRRFGPDPLCAGPGDEGATSRPDGSWVATARARELGGRCRARCPRRESGDRPLGAGCGRNEVLRPRRWRRGVREQLGSRAALLHGYRHPHRVDSQPPRLQQRGARGRRCGSRAADQCLSRRPARGHHRHRRRKPVRDPDETTSSITWRRTFKARPSGASEPLSAPNRWSRDA